MIVSLLALLLAPLAATLVQLAISRQREYLADASSVELTRNPKGMISALLKLDNSQPMEHHVQPSISMILRRRVACKSSFTLTHQFLIG